MSPKPQRPPQDVPDSLPPRDQGPDVLPEERTDRPRREPPDSLPEGEDYRREQV